MPGQIASLPGIGSLFQNTDGAPGRATANAATSAGAGAAPSIEATLPDVGMEQRNSPGAASPSVSPGAVPGIAAPAEDESSRRALPGIGAAPQTQVPGSANGTRLEGRDSPARRQEDLSRKEQELRVLESELSDKLDKMKILENRLAMMIKDAEETKDAKFRHLVDVLANMKSKQAAAVLETLDPKIAVRVLSGMRGRQAGEILTFVKPEIAAQLTEQLARMQLPLD